MKSTVYAHLENDYRFYRLPLFRATAVKYGWDNPIGEDSGRERKYVPNAAAKMGRGKIIYIA